MKHENNSCGERERERECSWRKNLVESVGICEMCNQCTMQWVPFLQNTKVAYSVHHCLLSSFYSTQLPWLTVLIKNEISMRSVLLSRRKRNTTQNVLKPEGNNNWKYVSLLDVVTGTRCWVPVTPLFIKYIVLAFDRCRNSPNFISSPVTPWWSFRSSGTVNWVFKYRYWEY